MSFKMKYTLDADNLTFYFMPAYNSLLSVMLRSYANRMQLWRFLVDNIFKITYIAVEEIAVYQEGVVEEAQ